MTRVASLYLPLLAIERLRRHERTAAPPEPRAAALPPPVDDDPGACSVPRGGGWRPGARWARAAMPGPAELARQVAALPAHQRPPMRMLGRRSEPVAHPFRRLAPGEERDAVPGIPAGTGRPTVLVERRGQRDLVVAACPLAGALGLVPGMASAHARALVGDLDVRAADPAADRAWLDRLALHAATHWTPTASVSGADGLWLDLTGCTHLFGGEARFCRRLVRFLARLGFTAQVAVAGTPGAAHALARFGGQDILRIRSGGEAAALAPLPVAALRLEPEALAAAGRFGLDRVADLVALPRGPLARRLGLATVTRLDQALGHAAEPVVPVVPQDMPRATRRLLEPIGTAESIARVIDDLVADTVQLLHARGLGARAALLTVERIDGGVQHIAIGAVRATRDAVHLARMFALRLDRIEPGPGIEAMALAVPHAEPLDAAALAMPVGDPSALCHPVSCPDLAPVIDRLVGRAGEGAVFRVGPVESDVPERAARRAGPLSAPGGWPRWTRPVRMLPRPERLSHVVALLPDHPPRRFRWRGRSYHAVAGDGPERIHGEWWRSDREIWAVRDYFRVEVEGGERFWLFRRGEGVTPEAGDPDWYMHGMFG